ncbi:MAG TPA: cation:proton antiporter, partial [Gemmatimonadaceae bacterium]|nr:cation:proton antiporter [Gemmatimonadaceae bacterium]
VLACVAGGLYLRRRFSAVVSPLSRLQNRSVWDLLVFVLNAAIFVLLGAQGRTMLAEAPPGTLGHLLLAGAIVAAVAIVVRLVWVPVATVAPRLFSTGVRRRDPLPPFRSVFLVAWTSMRGIVSLATALALPVTLASGAPFPFRREILVITMCVIVLTLVVQGLTLAPIIRAFRFAPEVHHHAESRIARLEAARRGAETLEDLSREAWVDPNDVARLRSELRGRIAALQSHDGVSDGERRLRSAMLRSERRMLVRLRNEGAISDEVLLELEQLLDLEAVRVGAGGER